MALEGKRVKELNIKLKFVKKMVREYFEGWKVVIQETFENIMEQVQVVALGMDFNEVKPIRCVNPRKRK